VEEKELKTEKYKLKKRNRNRETKKIANEKGEIGRGS
jgi:hypothetical protein